MTDEELIARLRKADEYEPLGHDGWEAADRIEALVKERDALKRLKNTQSQMLDAEEARAEAAEVVAEKLQAECQKLGREVNMARYGQPDFAWSIHKQAMAELQARAERLEAALRWYSDDPSSQGDVARAALKGADRD